VRIAVKAALEVLHPGLLTTVQDHGRRGFQKYGVPVSGAMDEWGLRVANALVGNPPGEAALEVTGVGPSLRIRGEVLLAVAAAEFALSLEGAPVPPFAAVRARDGEVLRFGDCRAGLRAYIAVAGGIDIPLVLGSRSTCVSGRYGGVEGRALRAGDLLPIGVPPPPDANPQSSIANPQWEGRFLPRRLWPRPALLLELRVVMGPQDDAFTPEGIATFLRSEYRVAPASDRQGCRLEGPPIAHLKGADVISDAIASGAVQVPGDGKPIILLADRQTTGGYTKIAAVIRPDLPALAQARAGDRVRFRAVSLAEAHTAVAAFDAGLREVVAAITAAAPPTTYQVVLDGVPRAVAVEEVAGGFRVAVDGREFEVFPGDAAAEAAGPLRVRSPLPGVVTQVHVVPGVVIAAGTRLVTLLAMKLQHDVTSAASGTVAAVHATPGREVQSGETLVEIAPPGD
jgi:biotin-dependent carboxylase-like uncharacterized protein